VLSLEGARLRVFLRLAFQVMAVRKQEVATCGRTVELAAYSEIVAMIEVLGSSRVPGRAGLDRRGATLTHAFCVSVDP
jgi:hypothetical protein